MSKKPDKDTRNWIRNRSDELAIEAGYRFDEPRGVFVCDWIEEYCHLYEGEFAGQKLKLQPWQRDFVIRLFGWVKKSEKWGRDVRRFRRASVWVPKKNGKSPTLAAIGLYLLCGDGEQGQKIYSVAKDGKQALISHTHAMEMVRRSPQLSAECTIHKTTSQITHEPTRSFYRIVAGDNPNSQEGLNGSVMVDETHVVDDRLMRILKGAGISRSEPIQLEVSTAGKNPDGYGKHQFDYGQQVQRGEVTDHGFFFESYSAPQEIEDTELDRNYLEIGKKANPSWGVTIDPEEFETEYKTSRKSLASFSDFKMYRLNIWQRSSNPWIRMSDWERCTQRFNEHEMEGMPCFAGLDLSKTRDMTAFVMVFPWDDGFRIIPRFWLPKSRAIENEHAAPFLQWAADGWLNLTDGDVIDYREVEASIVRDCERFRVQDMAFDPAFAEELTQRVSDASGVVRTAFPQRPIFIGPAADDFERAIIEHKLFHNGNPVMSWQVGHVQVKTDPINKLKRPIKPDNKESIRKIDGVMATIFGLRQAMQEPVSVYTAERGLKAW